MATNIPFGLGLKFKPPDPRDHMYAGMTVTIPTKPVDLRPINAPDVRNQGSTSSCTGFSSTYVATSTWRQARGGQEPPLLSPKYVYRRVRELEGDYPNDNGAYIQDVMKIWQKRGSCRELYMPWDHEGLNQTVPNGADQDAVPFRMDGYLRIGATRGAPILQGLLAWLSNEGVPAVLGIQVYASFMNPRSDGTVPMPDSRREAMYGGHAIACYGFMPNKRVPGGGYLMLLNSWGDEYGDHGYVYVPFNYVLTGIVQEAWGFRESA